MRDNRQLFLTFCSIAVCIAATWVLAEPTPAPPRQNETERQAAFRLAPKYGITKPEHEIDVRLGNGAEADYLPANSEYVYEIDFARKFQEGIGQSLEYAFVTGRKPALILLVRTKRDQRFVDRCKPVCEMVGIKLGTESSN
jgi:hypothetical protein